MLDFLIFNKRKGMTPKQIERCKVLLEEMENEQKLKPCPFCGEGAHIIRNQKQLFFTSISYDVWYAECGKCHCRTDYCTDTLNGQSGIVKATKSWNGRVLIADELLDKAYNKGRVDTIAEAAKIVAEWMPCIDCPMHCIDLQEDQCAENWALYLTDKLESE